MSRSSKPTRVRDIHDPDYGLPVTYPQHDKLCKVADQSQAIGEFLEWLAEKQIVLCTLKQGDYLPSFRGFDKLVAQFYGIDLDKLEREKQAMLKAMREAAT